MTPDNSYFVHKTTGKIWFDPKQGTKHYTPWWMLVIVGEGIIDFYAWLLKKKGIRTEPNKLWGPHISVIKGEEPTEKDLWGKNNGDIEFWYSNQPRWHEKHAWLDVYSPDLRDLRIKLGLSEKLTYHITIGKIA